MKNLVTNNKSNSMGDKKMKNFEELMMANKELAQENMVKILKTYFDRYGFNTPSFDNEEFIKDLSDSCTNESVEEIATLVEKKDKRMLNYLDDMSKTFNFILTGSDESVANYNKETSEQTRQSVFMMCLTFLLHINHIARPTNIIIILEAGLKSNRDIVKERTWGLATMLMNPQLVA